ncbi:hypothetical protein [Pollutimonas sp. M17]|uniref:hypothetical protein n=1 Tax=Pollutimonas sp. M17 TaxID=2962065 RepID=UPI0021F40274|nr:hypothetical protein [Pollutimonas sp. M17]UYO93991.1 hypothetical protein OEG81_01275 [Pollutimonas sp. M17]
MAIIGAAAFIYALCSMIFIREVAIPYIYPSAVDGHLPGDAAYYHSLAMEQLTKIDLQGISAFELRPKGQGAAGIASLLYLAIESPYSVVILNSVLHAAATLILILILRRWFTFRVSIIAASPLALSPYMMIWFSQINKESYMLLGVMLFVYGLIELLSIRCRPSMLRNLFIAISGVVLIGLVRPYANQILFPITAFIFSLAFLWQLRHEQSIMKLMPLAASAATVLLTLGLLTSGAASDKTLTRISNEKPVSIPDHPQSTASACLRNADPIRWANEAWLPDYIDTRLRSMMTQRCLVFTLLESQSNPITLDSIIDQRRLPSGSAEALGYLPRAVMIGVLSPWPTQWLYSFQVRPSIFYTISSIEAVLMYVAIFGSCIYIARRKRWLAAVPMTLALSFMTIVGMATPYIGAVYRYRYPWWMLVICVGIAASMTLFNEWKGKTP